MPSTVTPFDTSRPHIHIPFFVWDRSGRRRNLDGVLDTGAPKTELSDRALLFVGFLKNLKDQVLIQHGQQTQKYGKLVIPRIEICGHMIEKLEVYSSRFEESWGVDALIGLDFFRRFRTTIDYGRGEIVTEGL